MARLLAKTPATPNQVSVFALLVAFGSMAAYISGMGLAAGLLVQFSSIVDGADGDLARLTGKTSAFGGFFDSILDRYADAAILLGLTYWAADGATDGVWIVGFAAMAGTFVITYTRARINSVPSDFFDRGITSLASRDIRLMVVMIGSIAGLGLATIWIIAVLTNVVVILRLIRARSELHGQ
jgi:phosphatidylglycerophosphate synthase